MKVKPCIVVILLLISLGLSALSPAEEAAQVTVQSKNVDPGAETGVRVSVSGIPAPGLSDFQGELAYDPAVLTVDEVRGASGYTLFGFKIDNDKGEVRFVAAKVSGDLIQDGDILEFVCRAVGNQGESSTLGLTLETFNDPDGKDIPRTINDGTFSIAAPEPPQAGFAFSPEKPNVNQEIQFTDQSEDPDGDIKSWSWDFGDGATSTEENPTHNYTAKGKYTVKLTVTDDGGLTDAASKTVPVGFEPPIASFTFSPKSPKVGKTVRFTDQSSDPDGQIQSWSWDFGDRNSSTERNPNHQYAEAGTYTVKLTVTDDDDLTATTTEEITVEPGPPTVTVHCFPNPASTQAVFRYALPGETDRATLWVFNLTGKLVFHQDVTGTEYTWDLQSDGGNDLPNGPYFYYIIAFDAEGKRIARSTIGKLVIQRS